MELQTPNVEDYSILAWILKNNVTNEKGEPLDFHDRLFLLDILTDWNPNIVVKKCVQIGGSVTFNFKALFAVSKLKLHVIYTMPTDDDIKEFVGTKTNKLLQANPKVFAGIQTDNVERKEVDGRFLYFKGTVSKTAAIATTADLLIHDEASRSDQGTLKTYEGRTKASKYKGRWLFSNPTTEKDAVDEAWQESDQKEWNITCACGEVQNMTFPESIDKERKCFICKACKKELTKEERRLGKWIPQNPGSKISGYHISLLMAPWISAEEILKDSEGDQEYFYNFILGEPYNPGDLKVSRATILDNWTPKDLSKGHDWFLGVDVGNIKHYVLGTELGVVQVGKFSKWSELDDLMNFYNPALVIDAMPDNTMSKHYVDNYPRALMSYFQENKINPATIVWWGNATSTQNQQSNKLGVVYSNRNRVIDKMIDEILLTNILFGVPSDLTFKQYVKHWETLRRTKETDTKGIEHYVWQSTTGEDHFVFATLYYYLARLSIGAGTVFSGTGDGPYSFIPHDNTVGDLSEMFNQANPTDNA